MKLDLHGTKHEDVKSKVIRFVESHWDSGNELQVITGKSGQMIHLVQNVLDEYRLDYNIGGFWDYNPGYITVYT